MFQDYFLKMNMKEFFCILCVMTLLSPYQSVILRSKKNVDFGLSRSNSGNEAAKSLIGQYLANQANGPGRKRALFDMYGKRDRMN
uniref:Venom protein n=1 Tax=Centruroides hentzi TaxID=88313 RepID=A0A2I9LPY4_9SCOR